ncbi:cardiolipin synthase [Mycoplasma zalophi]|uniref:cardiolipin synthase n=1 Tax=Mycoplasma zalophi TaxID=191287 RepID=UPI0021CAA92C|nr:cardiolipin synthase [Mycoplasma zalophi]MCU4117439.1 cardiolipin synthase [Mycoplasma zalophi]
MKKNLNNKKIQTVIYYILLILLFISITFILYFFSKYNNKVLFAILIALYFLNLIFNLIIFSQDRSSESKQSWQFIFAIFPLIGHVLYIIFGQKYLKSMTISEYKKETSEIFVNEQKYDLTRFKENEKFREFEKISKMSNRLLLPANIITFDNGFHFFYDIFKELEKAQKYIFIETYIMKPGEIFDQLKEILLRKVKQGVEIKILVDDFGSWDMPSIVLKNLEDSGIQIAKAEKIAFPFITSVGTYRSHRKFITIDGNITYTGGCNISDEYANYSKKYGVWKDSNIKLIGPANDFYVKLFLYDWQKQSYKIIENPKTYFFNHEQIDYQNLITSIEDGPITDYPLLESTLIKILMEAENSISFSTPYFIPTKRLEMAIIGILSQGIKVTIYIPGFSDKNYVYYATIDNLKTLVEYGLEVIIVKNTFLHAKMAVIDDKIAYLGTMNLDYRSFYSQFEIANFYIGEATEDIKQIFEQYNKLHDKEAYEKLFKRKHSRFMYLLGKLFKPVL